MAARALCKAARQGDLALVGRILEVWPDSIDMRNRDGRTALIVGIRHSHMPVVQLLLSQGAEINGRSGRSGATPTWHAAWKGDSEMVSLLIRHGARCDDEAVDCGTPLMVSSQYGHVEVCSRLLETGVDVDTRQQTYHCTALWWACRSAHVEVARLLLEAGADASLVDWRGRTPQSIATAKGHHACVVALEDAERTMEVVRLRTLCDTVLCFANWQLHVETAARPSYVMTALRERFERGEALPKVEFSADGNMVWIGVGAVVGPKRSRRRVAGQDLKWTRMNAQVLGYVLTGLKPELFTEVVKCLR